MSTEHYTPPAHHDAELKSMVRWLIAFVLGLILVVALVFWNAQRLAQWLPFSMEQRFVQPYVELGNRWFGDEYTPEEAAVQAYLQALADELAVEIGMPDHYVITVHYMEEQDAVNAFATLGGHMFVLDGLLKAMPDENSLAMVIAHELAHIKHRDPVAGLGRGLALQMLYSFFTGDFSTGGADVLGASGELGALVFSRQQESSADLAGIEALQARYGHALGYDTIFRQLDAELPDEGVPEWMSSHPGNQKRIDALADYAQGQGWALDGPKTPLPEFADHASASSNTPERSTQTPNKQ